MGSLVARPNIPPPAPLIYNLPRPVITPRTPAPTVTPAPTPDTSADPGENTDTQDAARAEARTAGLLGRNRGTLGTVLTGFRGLLSNGASTGGARKTLLGE